MRSKPSILVLCALCTSLVVGLSACRSYKSDHVRLSGWLSFPGEETLVQDLVDQYELTHAGTGIEYQPITANYNEKIQLMLGTGTAPDVFMVEAFWAPNLISYDVLQPLDSMIAADTSFAIEDIEPSLLDAFRVDGKLYGIPKDYSTLALYYNPELFAERGLTEPPSNWEEVREYARILTLDRDSDGTTDQYGLAFSESLDFFLPLVWQNGGDFFDENGDYAFVDSTVVNAITYVKEMHDEGIAILPTQVGAAWNMDAFGRKRVAMAISGLWADNFLRDTFSETPYRVAMLPHNGTPASIAFIVGYVIPRDSPYKSEAWELLSYLTGKKGQLAWAEAGVGLPPRYSVVAEKAMRQDPVKSVFIDSAPHARPWQLGEDQRIFSEAQTALQAIFLTDAPVLETLEQLEDRLTR